MLKQQLTSKQNQLDTAQRILKTKFFGIDSVIDQVIEGIRSWFFFPEYQSRPLVINLWGMTGVGKSDLVRSLVELLDFQQNYYMFDCGEIGEKSTGTLRSILIHLEEMEAIPPQILFFDEIQLMRSISENGNEVDGQNSRAIWQILDNGQLSFQTEWYFRNEKIHSLLAELKYFIKKGLKIEKGIVDISEESFLISKHSEKYGSVNTEEWSEFISKPKNRMVLNKEEISELFTITGFRNGSKAELEDKLLSMDGHQLLNFLQHVLDRNLRPRYLDLSKSLIFVAGNLDEVYAFSKNLNPDISPDYFHERTKSINLQDVKNALLKRFRAEQISRLGNNHIIYPSLNSESYQKIIEKELSKIKVHLETQTSVTVKFSQKMKDWIFREGITPTQGVRPLKSTIRYSVEDLIPKILLDLTKMATPIEEIIISYSESQIEVTFMIQKNEIEKKSYSVLEKMYNLRKSKQDDTQAITAVHEAGHTLAYLSLFNLVPEMVLSVAAESGNNGMMVIEPIVIMNLEIMRKKAAVLLAGQEAERFVFGENYISSGAYSDIEQATILVMSLMKEAGFNGEMIRFANNPQEYSDYYHRIDDLEEVVKTTLENAQLEARKILMFEEKLFLEISRTLADHSSISKEELNSLIQEHGSKMIIKKLASKEKGYRDLLFSKIEKFKDTNCLMININ